MEKQTKIKTASKIALFGASIIWGSSFLVVKSSMDSMQPHTLLAIRFTIGSLLLCAIFYKRLKLLNKDYLISGGILGAFLFIAYSIQTIGIIGTTPGKNAFLTAIYCVIVPYLYWIVNKKKPDKYNIIAAILCLTGIGFVSLNSDLRIQYGDAFSLISGFFYAAHMVAISKLAKDRDPVLLTIVQFIYTAIISWVVTLLFEDLPKTFSPNAIGELLYLAIFATAIALLLQNIGQKYTKPAQASIILSLEAVFGVIFSVIFFKEEISPKLFIGFLFIFIAILTSETKWSFLKKMLSFL
ncbi:MAG: EamA family transporter [Anaerolineaceae bacterium]|nr:MAG: EamA family transporter [Anaerolineaceae bacterium]